MEDICMQNENMQGGGGSTPPGYGLAVAAMILGIISVLGGAITLILPIIGIFLAASSNKNNQLAGFPPSGMGTAGLVLNIIALVFVGLPLLACTVCAGGVGCLACFDAM